MKLALPPQKVRVRNWDVPSGPASAWLGRSVWRPFRARRLGGRLPGLKPWAELSSPCGAQNKDPQLEDRLTAEQGASSNWFVSRSSHRLAGNQTEAEDPWVPECAALAAESVNRLDMRVP
jgi:hypothetical protein